MKTKEVFPLTAKEIFAGETDNVEFKVDIPPKSEKYMKTVVAFANVIEETNADTKEELQDLINQYIADNRVTKIEIVK